MLRKPSDDKRGSFSDLSYVNANYINNSAVQRDNFSLFFFGIKKDYLMISLL